MKRKKISETIENINPKYIDEATEYTGAVKSNSKKVWYKWVAAAACFALVFAIGFPFAKDLLISPGQKDTVEPIIMVEYDNSYLEVIEDSKSIKKFGLEKEITEEIIGRLQWVGPLLQGDKASQRVQGKDILRHSDKKQIGDLFPVVLFFHRTGDQIFFHIIADHGRCQRVFTQGCQIFINIFGGLFQVQTHIGNFIITGQTEVRNGLADQLLGFLFHKFITMLYYS